jgi:hypothetical protein
VRANVSSFSLGRLLDPEVSVDTAKDVQGLSLIPGRKTVSPIESLPVFHLLMDSLGLYGKHRSRVQDDTKLVLNDFGESQLVAFFNRLEALANLRVLSEGLEFLEQAEVLEPFFSSNTLSDQVGKLRVGLMDESARSDTYDTASAYALGDFHFAYHWSRS